MRGAYVNNAETEEVPATTPVSATIAKSRNGASPTTIKLARRLGLRHVSSDVLSIRRRRCGKGWTYLAPNGRTIRDRGIVRRLARLAVPPAYADVLYAEDPAAHLQAIGRDAAGRLQYRYHPDWEKVREIRKAARLARLADVLPRIRRSVGQHLSRRSRRVNLRSPPSSSSWRAVPSGPAAKVTCVSTARAAPPRC